MKNVIATCCAGLVTVCLLAADAAADDFHWRDDPEAGVCDLLLGEQPVLQYVYRVDTSTEVAAFDTAKVFHHVYGPGAAALITKGPGGKYPHHRGLYVGWNKMTFDGKTQDFWHCRNGETQRHVEFIELAADAESARMQARVRWIDREGEPVIDEVRTVAVRTFETPGDPGYGWQIDWSSELASRRGEIMLDGDRQHAGFQFRAAQYVAETDSARYIRPEGFPQQPEAFQVNDRNNPDDHVNLGWLAMTYEIEGQPYCVEYFESPALPRPSRYSERPYGRFGAFFATKLTEDEPLKMQYRLQISRNAEPSAEVIQQRFEDFAGELAQ